MTLMELYLRAHVMLFEEHVDPNLKVGVRGHYGELESELDGLRRIQTKQRPKSPDFVALEGILSSYPEPD